MLMNAELYDALKHAQGVSDEQGAGSGYIRGLVRGAVPRIAVGTQERPD
jgi:hypothetical protein